MKYHFLVLIYNGFLLFYSIEGATSVCIRHWPFMKPINWVWQNVIAGNKTHLTHPFHSSYRSRLWQWPAVELWGQIYQVLCTWHTVYEMFMKLVSYPVQDFMKVSLLSTDENNLHILFLQKPVTFLFQICMLVWDYYYLHAKTGDFSA